MSSQAMSLALALRKKAGELHEKGHLLRAAQLYARAAEAARSLDPGVDNFVTLHALQLQASALFSHFSRTINNAVDADVDPEDPEALAACCAEIITLLTAVTAALERRRMAGTLLEGRCTAAEDAWYADNLRQCNNLPSAVILGFRPLFGYMTFIAVAKLVLTVLLNAVVFAEKCHETQFESFTQFVVCAMDLITLPHRFTAAIIPNEAYFVLTLVEEMPRGATGLDLHLNELLTNSWQRLLQSGVLQRRCLLDKGILRKFGASSDEFLDVVNSAMTAPGLRNCTLASCGAREAHPQHFKACAACRSVVYCSREHQVADWPAHKAACKAARKAAAADKGAGAASDARA